MRRALIIGLMLCAAGVLAADPFKDITRKLNKNLDAASKNAKEAVSAKQGEVAEMNAEEKKCSELAAKPVSFEDELALGGAVSLKLVSMKGLVIDTGALLKGALKAGALPPKGAPANQLARYVNTVGRLVAAHSQRAQLEWKFGILKDDQTVNAWSTPGGYVFVTTGLLRRVKNEDQLAGVLAHEIAHVTAKDALKHYAALKNTECKAALAKPVTDTVSKGVRDVGAFAAKTVGASPVAKFVNSGKPMTFTGEENVDLLAFITEAVTDNILNKGNGEAAEIAADQMATDLLIDSGYSVREFSLFLEGLSGGGLFSNHPSGSSRRKTVVDYASKTRVIDELTPPPPSSPHPLGEEVRHLASIK